MNWYEILVMVIGAFGGVSGIASFYTAKPNKTRLEIDNLKSIIDEERKERELLREEYKEYKEDTDKKIEEQQEEIRLIKKNKDRKNAAILNAYKCDKIQSVDECPVIESLKENKE